MKPLGSTFLEVPKPEADGVPVFSLKKGGEINNSLSF